MRTTETFLSETIQEVNRQFARRQEIEDGLAASGRHITRKPSPGGLESYWYYRVERGGQADTLGILDSISPRMFAAFVLDVLWDHSKTPDDIFLEIINHEKGVGIMLKWKGFHHIPS